MADGRSGKTARPGSKRASSKKAGAASGARKRNAAKSMKRTVVLDGIFSIEELEVTATSSRKAAKTTKKKAVSKKKAAPKKQARKKAASGAKPKKERKVARNGEPVAKTSGKPASAALGPVVLGHQPGIKNIAELKNQLTAARSADSTVVVDAGNVESIDTAALQLLVAFANSVREQSRTVEWKEPSSVFREMANLADLSRCLGIGDNSVAEEDDGLCPVF